MKNQPGKFNIPSCLNKPSYCLLNVQNRSAQIARGIMHNLPLIVLKTNTLAGYCARNRVKHVSLIVITALQIIYNQIK
jgi:hypothetical protein